MNDKLVNCQNLLRFNYSASLRITTTSNRNYLVSFNSFHIKKSFPVNEVEKRELIITNLLLFDQFSD